MRDGFRQKTPARSNVALKLFDSYEAGLMVSAPLSEGDKIAKGRVVSSALKNALNAEIAPEGYGKPLKAIDLIAINVVADMIENPSISKLKEASAVLGELKEGQTEIVISMTDRGFRDMSIGPVEAEAEEAAP